MVSGNDSTSNLLHALSLLEIKLAKLEQRSFEQAKQLHDRDALIGALRAEIEALRNQHLAALNEVDRRGHRLLELRDGYESSTSWRVTRPLRWLRQLFSGGKAKLPSPPEGLVEAWPNALSPPPDESCRQGAPSHSVLALETVETASLPVADRHDYAEWIRRFDTPSEEQRAAFRNAALSAPDPALVTLLSACSLPRISDADMVGMQAVRDGLTGQLHLNWEWLIVCGREALECLKSWAMTDPRIHLIEVEADASSPWKSLNAGLQQASGDWVAWIDALVQLREHALLDALEFLRLNPAARLLYADDDRVDGEGTRSSPAFRCDANEELLKASDYLGQLVLCRRQDLIEAGGWDTSLAGAHRHDMWLRLAERWNGSVHTIIHLPRILSHRRKLPEDAEQESMVLLPCWTDAGNKTTEDRSAVPDVVQAHLDRQGMDGVALPHPTLSGACRVRFTMPDPQPRVGIVIPTRDSAGVLSVCLESLLQQSTYPDFRVMVVDNGSVKPETFTYLEAIDDPRVQVVRDDAPFNFSRLINRGAAVIEGEILCLLNNDMQITQPDWLEEMVGWALQEGVAAVGARLWYGDDTLQHGGIVLGIQGMAGHAHKHLPKGQPGYLNRAVLHQTVSAVTGACMVVRRSVFEEMNGFEEALGVAYNDVDFCLRARKAGYRNVWTPHAEMIHHESISRGFEDSPEKQARFQTEAALMRERWGTWLDKDPAYNPNLTLEHEDFGLAWPPRIRAT